MTHEETKIAVMCNDMDYVKKTLEKIDRRLDSNYVTKVEFEPIKKGYYGLLMLIVTTIIIAVLSQVIK